MNGLNTTSAPAAVSRAALLCGAAVCLGLYGPAAQATESDRASAEAPASVDEVVVTARRREESLARVPVTVAVVSADALEKRSVSSQADLQAAVPGLVVRATQGSNQLNYAIRGQSIDAFSSSQPGVLAYVNEFQTNALSAGSLYDLTSVQVLKGPQGTLFGRNTTGGAVLYSTARPEFDAAAGEVRGRIGNLGLVHAEGGFNLPAGDAFALRIAGAIEKRDGFVRNLVNGRRLNNVDRASGRISLRWRPTERFETSLVGEIGQAKGHGDALLLYSANAPGATGPDGLPLVSVISTFYSPLLNTIAGPGAFEALTAQFPFTPSGGFLAAVAQQKALGNRRTALDADTGLDAKSRYLISTSTYDVSDDARIKNILGYSYNRNLSQFDEDGSPFPFYAQVNTLNKSDAWSEELQLSGTAMSGSLNYITGVYYSLEKRENFQDFSYFDLGPIANPILGPGFGAPSLPLFNKLWGTTETESLGAFVQVSQKLDAVLNGLSATAGFRYTQEKNRFTEISGFAPFFPSGVQLKSKDSKPSWTVGLEYQATETLFLYGTYRGSWRGGGFNYNAPPINAPAQGGGNRFAPETTEDVEFGAKFQGRLGGAPARLNVSIFKQWVDDVQRIAYVTIPGVGPAAVTVNAPGASFKGLEADGEISPLDWLKIGGAFNYTGSRYTGSTANNLFGVSFEFSTFADIPKYSGSLFVEAHWDLANDLGQLSLRADGYAQAPMWFSNFGKTSSPGTRLPSYELINARAAVNDIRGTNVSAAVFVKNAFDKAYFVGGIGLGTAPGYSTAVPGEPRMYGVELAVRF